MDGTKEYAQIMSYVMSARKHGVSFLDAIHAALQENAITLVEQWG